MSQTPRQKEYMATYRLTHKAEQAKLCKDWRNKKLLEDPDFYRKAAIKKRYGLDWDDYLVLLSQGCEVCGSMKNLHCDHDHTTGKVRGCLCNKCNVNLGGYEHVLNKMEIFKKYLEKHNVAL
jgi:hypothetical protein